MNRDTVNTSFPSINHNHRSGSKPGIALTALFLVLGTETVFFATMLASYVSQRINAGSFGSAHSLPVLLLPSMNTLILIVSALTITFGESSIQKGRVRKLSSWLAVTLVLGSIFVIGQLVEFTRSGMRPDDPTFGGIYFALIGFHAVHVIAGMVLLALNLYRSSLGDFSSIHHTAVQVGTWFWYYVTAVWIVLFTALFLL